MKKNIRKKRSLRGKREKERRKKKVARGRENEHSENAHVAMYDPIFDKDNVLLLRTVCSNVHT